MMWFAASVVIWFKEKERNPEDACRLRENVILIEAETPEAALLKAEKRGRLYALPDPTLTLDGEPADAEYVGIRKLIEIRSFDGDDEPIDGAEITFSDLITPDQSALLDFAKGKEVDVTVLE